MGDQSEIESKRLLTEKLIIACERITTGKQTFSSVLKDVDLSLLEHPEVPFDDLRSLYTDLRRAAELEDILQGLMDEAIFIRSLYRLKQIRKQPIKILIEPPDFLKGVNPRLPHELQEHIIDLQKKVSQASNSSINNLSREVDKGTDTALRAFDPYQLLRKYWQLYWCLVSEVIEDAAVSTSALYAIGKAQKMPHSKISELAQQFEVIDTVKDLVSIERYLSALRFFNLGLISLPIIDGDKEPLVDLPPLPEGQTYPDVDPELNEDALDGWHRVIIQWLSMFDTNSKGETQTRDLRKATQDSQKIHEDLQYLKKQVWPKLELPYWKADSPLGMLESEASLLLNLGAALDEGGIDWANMKAMEVISYLDEQSQVLDLAGPEAGNPPTDFFAPYHTILIEAVDDVRQRALDRIDRQVINILRDRTKSVKRLQAELLKKPQSKETARYVHDAIIRTGEELTLDAIQSNQRKDAISIWGRIREATRPWAFVRLANRHYPELSPEINRWWRKIYRHAYSRGILVRFAGRRREVIIAASLMAAIALIALGSIALNAVQSTPPTEERVVQLGTSTLNLPATMRFQTSAAKATESDFTSTAFAVQVQESKEARESTATVNAAYQLASTQEANIARAQTATAEEIARDTEIQQAILDQTATATAKIYILRATYEAILCRNNPSFLSYELKPTPQISPDIGTRYYVGTSPFTVTATWTITNTSECRWGYLGLEPLSDEDLDITYSYLRADGEPFDLGPENTVAVSETIQIVANFNPLQVRSVNTEWVLVVNHQELTDFPHAGLNVRNWIIPIYPPTRTPTPSDNDDY